MVPAAEEAIQNTIDELEQAQADGDVELVTDLQEQLEALQGMMEEE